MKITPTSEAVGAEVTGVDVRELDDEMTAQIEQAWAHHGVLFFRDQQLGPDDHLRFAERFAEIDVNKFFTPVDTHPRIAEVRKEPHHDVNVGGSWHTDHSYDKVPARGSILVAKELPPAGGDTSFAGVGAAFDALSDGLKDTLRSLRAVHSNRHAFGADTEHHEKMSDRFHNPEAVGDTEHPVVVAHPVTGRPLLYVNPGFTRHFVGWTMEESAPLLEFLYEHITAPQFTTRFEWKPGSVAMWDNRATWHFAHNDYPGHRRLMHRITVRGVDLSPANA